MTRHTYKHTNNRKITSRVNGAKIVIENDCVVHACMNLNPTTFGKKTI